MLSFKQLSEKKTKIKINPKKDEIVEGQKKKKDDSYLETNMKKRQANNEKARKDLMKGPQMKNPHFESTEENAYVSQEEVSEEGYQEIEAETETDLTESFSTKTGKSASSALPGSVGAKAGTTYASKKDFKQAYRSNPGAFKSPLPGGMGSYMNSVKPSARNAYTSQRPSMGMPVGLQKSMFNSGLGKKLGGGGNFMKAAMKANNVTIDKKAGKSAGGKVKKEEVDISLLTFDQYQHAKTLDEEQLNEFLGKLFGGGSKSSSKPSASSAPPAKPANPLQGVMTGAGSSQGSRSMMGRAGQAGAPMSKPSAGNSSLSGRPSTKQVPKPLEKIKKEEVEPVNEFNLGSLFGGGKKPAGGSAPGGSSGQMPSHAGLASKLGQRRAMMNQMMGKKDTKVLGFSKGGKVPAKVKKEHHLRSFGSFLNERTRYAKETGKDFTTGNPSEKGGEGRSEVGKHMQKIMRPTGGAMSSRKKAIQPQGKKKEKGKKGYEGVTPVDKIKNKLSRKRAPKKDPYGYGQGRYQGD